MVGDVTAADADRMHFGHVFGRGHQGRHRAERLAQVVHVQAGGDDTDTALSQLPGHVDNGLVEELGLVDTDDIDTFRLLQDAPGGIDRGGENRIPLVGHDGFLGIAGIDFGLEDFDTEIGELGAFEPADEFLGLAGKHGTADDFDPAGVFGTFYEHFSYFCRNKGKKKMAKLYIVPTPVGNLEDITLRALRILREADLILAEDTRTSSVLLKHYEIQARMESHHKFNEHERVESVKQRILSGQTVALISDAGTPGISDPGFLLVRTCVEAGIEVETLPGATAFVPALVNSGFPCDRFCFEGFLPVKKGRQTKLAELAAEKRTMIFYESPFRLVKTLGQFVEVFGPDRPASVSREISKLHDTTHRGTLQELFTYFSKTPPKGEIVLIVSGDREKESTK